MSAPASRPTPPTALVESLRAYFAARPEVWAAYLFGSTALETDGPLSDVDVAVLREPLAAGQKAWDVRAAYAGEIEQRLGRPVDVVLLQEADDTLSEAILREGLVVSEADPARHRDFQASRLLRCLDFHPTRELTERGLGAAIRREARGP